MNGIRRSTASVRITARPAAVQLTTFSYSSLPPITVMRGEPNDRLCIAKTVVLRFLPDSASAVLAEGLRNIPKRTADADDAARTGPRSNADTAPPVKSLHQSCVHSAGVLSARRIRRPSRRFQPTCLRVRAGLGLDRRDDRHSRFQLHGNGVVVFSRLRERRTGVPPPPPPPSSGTAGRARRDECLETSRETRMAQSHSRSPPMRSSRFRM